MATKKSVTKMDPLNTITGVCTRKTFCGGMQMALDGDDDKPSGFTMAHMFSLDGSPAKNRLVYKPQKKGSPNILLNACPWCRVELAGLHDPKPVKKRTKKEPTSV